MKRTCYEMRRRTPLTVTHFCRTRTKRPTNLLILSGQPRATHTVLMLLHPPNMFGDISRSVLRNITSSIPQSRKS